MKFLVLTISIIFLFSCSSESKENNQEELQKESLISEITRIEQNAQSNSISENEQLELIKLLSDYFHTFPNDEKAPECIDKIQMIYSAMEDYHKASLYADTLLVKFPKYINRQLVLESQAANYDIFIKPRDTSKVRYYNELILKEFPELEEEKKKEITKRLKNLHLDFQENCELQKME